MTTSIVQPEGWVAPKGYSNGIVAQGKMLFTGGVVGWNPRSATPEFPQSFAGQFEQALKNIAEILNAAHAKPEQLVRMTVYVTDKREYLSALKEIGAAWKAILGRNYPAMALVQVVALVEDQAKVEIEATACLD